MDIEVRPCASIEELRDALNAISHYFGHENTRRGRRAVREVDRGRAHARCLRRRRRSSAARARSPTACRCPAARSVPAGGVTVVGVLPTHRRRGVLTAMMQAQLEDCRARGDVVAYLWASEATIYGRFGYGLASRIGAIDAGARAHAFRAAVRAARHGAAASTSTRRRSVFPPLYEQVVRAAARDVLAQQGVVGDAQAERRSRAAPRRAAATARCSSSTASRPATRSTASQQDWAAGVSKRHGDDPGGGDADAGGDARALALAARLRLDVASSTRRPAAARPSALPAARRAAADAVPGQRRRLGAAARRRGGACRRARSAATARSCSTYAMRSCRRTQGAGAWPRAASSARTPKPEIAPRRLRARLGLPRRLHVPSSSCASFRAEELVDGAVARADALFATSIEPWCAEIF